MTLLLTPARIAALDIPIIGAAGQAGNDGSPFGAPPQIPMSGTTSAVVVETLASLQANETGVALDLALTVAGRTGGRGGSGTDATAQNGGNDGSGGWVTLSLAALAIGTAAAPFRSMVNVSLDATGVASPGVAATRGRAARPAAPAIPIVWSRLTGRPPMAATAEMAATVAVPRRR